MDKVYYCQVCGKVSPTKTGEGGDYGWNVSCYINSVLIPKGTLLKGKSYIKVSSPL